jgi:hypothetical protein
MPETLIPGACRIHARAYPELANTHTQVRVCPVRAGSAGACMPNICACSWHARAHLKSANTCTYTLMRSCMQANMYTCTRIRAGHFHMCTDMCGCVYVHREARMPASMLGQLGRSRRGTCRRRHARRRKHARTYRFLS